MNFKPGDVVQVKSGGPHMTVSKMLDDGDVWCIWFKDDSPTGQKFPAVTLTIVSNDSITTG